MRLLLTAQIYRRVDAPWPRDRALLTATYTSADRHCDIAISFFSMYSIRPITPPFGSSPPSSPNPYLDSSPASSPGFGSFDTNLPDVPALQLSDPFAASVKATRRPPEYEKKRLTTPLTPPSRPSAKKPRREYQQVGEHEPKLCWPSSPSDEYFHTPVPVKTQEQIEDAIWDEASTKVVDEGHGAVNLESVLFVYLLISTVFF